MGKNKTFGAGLIIASIFWEVGYIWVVEFSWLVTGICALIFLIGLGLWFSE